MTGGHALKSLLGRQESCSCGAVAAQESEVPALCTLGPDGSAVFPWGLEPCRDSRDSRDSSSALPRDSRELLILQGGLRAAALPLECKRLGNRAVQGKRMGNRAVQCQMWHRALQCQIL